MKMERGVLVLAVVLLVAGCTGGNGPTTQTAPGTTTSTSTHEQTAGPTTTTDPATSTAGPTTTREAIPGEHPAVTDGTVDSSTLLGDHLATLRDADSLTVLNNRTGTYVANGTTAFRSSLTNKIDLANTRQHLTVRVYDDDGDLDRHRVQVSNATTTCTGHDETLDCTDTGVDTRRLLGSTVETTSLETLAAPAFTPAGIVEHDGHTLYRYTATEFRTDIDSNTQDELFGDDPTLVDATLLVHPSGRIVQYTITYTTGGDTDQRLALTYRTTAINTTTVDPLRDRRTHLYSNR